MVLFLRKRALWKWAFAALVLGVGLLIVSCSQSTGSEPRKVDTTITGITFSGFGDESITLDPYEDEVSVGDTLEVTVTGDYDSYEWYLDGARQDNNTSTFTLTIPSFPFVIYGERTLTVIVEIGGKLYSKAITFTVIE